MAQRIVVDPITRIEGHLRIEADVDNGKIVNAFSSGTTFRGLERIMEGTRSPGCLGFRPANLRGLYPYPCHCFCSSGGGCPGYYHTEKCCPDS